MMKKMIATFKTIQLPLPLRRGSRWVFGLLSLLILTSCFGGKETMASGGELTGTSGKAFAEPAPYGMILVKRGHLKMGLESKDSLWGRETPLRDISIEGFWMDDTEITNSEYRQFVR